jgi:hypothetical protein
MIGRPPFALGIWPDMLAVMVTEEDLADVLAVSSRHLRRVFTGLASLQGPRAELSILFAAKHGIPMRQYIHPSKRAMMLVSAADGWFEFSRGQTPVDRVPALRKIGEDWSSLPSLEVPFGQ